MEGVRAEILKPDDGAERQKPVEGVPRLKPDDGAERPNPVEVVSRLKLEDPCDGIRPVEGTERLKLVAGIAVVKLNGVGERLNCDVVGRVKLNVEVLGRKLD